MDKQHTRNPLADPRPIAGGADTDDLLPAEVTAGLADLGQVDAEALADLEAQITTAFDEADGDTPDVARMEALADALDQVRAEQTRRADEAAAAATRAEELRTRVRAEADPEDEGGEGETATDDGSGEGEGEGDQGDGVQTTVETETTVEQEPQAVAAAARTTPDPAAMSRNRPADRAPQPSQEAVLPAIVAAGDVPGFSAGSEMGPDEVGEAFARKVLALMGTKGGRYPVATIRADYPEERTLVASGGGTELNTRRVQSALDEVEELIAGGAEAIVAAGGICAPVGASYDLQVVASSERPVRDSLLRFGADRGGIRFIPPPTLAGLSGGITVWTEANDRAPAAPATKPCVMISCGTEQTVLVDAIPLCIKVGNFSRRFFPEQFRAWYELGLAAHARVADGRLLTKIGAGSVAVTEAKVLGVARDIIEQYARLGAQYRSRQRMSPGAALTALLPAWVQLAMCADLIRQGAGDDIIGSARARIDAAFREENINVSWYLDEESGANQVYGAQGAGAGLGWKGTAVGYLFHPGAWMFLDGGELDLGVDIRDSALNSTNDVQAFVETFEGAAYNGVESLKVTSTICVSGTAGSNSLLTCV